MPQRNRQVTRRPGAAVRRTSSSSAPDREVTAGRAVGQQRDQAVRRGPGWSAACATHSRAAAGPTGRRRQALSGARLDHDPAQRMSDDVVQLRAVRARSTERTPGVPLALAAEVGVAGRQLVGEPPAGQHRPAGRPGADGDHLEERVEGRAVRCLAHRGARPRRLPPGPRPSWAARPALAAAPAVPLASARRRTMSGDVVAADGPPRSACTTSAYTDIPRAVAASLSRACNSSDPRDHLPHTPNAINTPKPTAAARRRWSVCHRIGRLRRAARAAGPESRSCHIAPRAGPPRSR